MLRPEANTSPILTVKDSVATLQLNRPAKRNRLEPDDLHLLIEHCSLIQANPDIRVVVFTANTDGQPRPTFCAGYDMGGFEGSDQDTDLFENMVEALADLRPVVIGALNGSVYGGATDMALACDLRIGLSGCEFRMPAAAIGLHYYPSGLRRYVANLGINAARWAFLTARPIPVEKLESWGVLMQVLDAPEFSSAVQALVTDVQQLAPLATQSTKQSLREMALGMEQLEELRQRQVMTLKSEDFSEGRQAFKERRSPEFKGQ